MKTHTLFTLIIITLLGKVSFGQDTTYQIDFAFYPLQHNNLKYDCKIHNGPILSFQIPLKEKWSISFGFLFRNYSGEIHEQPPSLYDYYKFDCVTIRMPLFINFRIFNNKRLFIYASGGFDQPVWILRHEEKGFYSNTSDVEMTYFKGFNLFSDPEDLPLDFSFVLKYYPLKRIGLIMYPFTSYNPFDGRSSFIYGLGMGVCFR